MLTFESPADMRAWRAQVARQGERVALVPTMGALHAGHLELVAQARALADRVAVSIFVNPTQFGPGEDYARYPRTLAQDCAACAQAGVQAVFLPTRDAMYAADHSVYVVEGRLTRGLCGPHRPGHFRGVLTVVTQLFNIVQPDVAIMGQKDAQQARLIQRLVRDLHMPTQVWIAPTVREPDGLAMSSRNRYLDAAERRRACCLSAALFAVEADYAKGERRAVAAVARVREACTAGIGADAVQYVEAVDFETLAPATELAEGVLLAAAVRVGTTRLIDNVLLGRARVRDAFHLL